jgi:hypothetical protein
MNLIHAIRRPAGILLWLALVVLASLTAAMPAALAAPRPRPPGWNKHPPPADPYPLATSGIPGWQLAPDGGHSRAACRRFGNDRLPGPGPPGGS